MYVNRNQIPVFEALGAMDDPVFAALGAEQTGTIPAGTVISIPAGTVVSLFDPAVTRTPVEKTLSQALAVPLIGATGVTGDVVGRDLVSAGGEATLAVDAGATAPSMVEGMALKSGYVVGIPAGTVVTVLQLPSTPPGPTPPIVSIDPARPVVTPWYKRPRTYIAAGAVAVVLTVVVVALARSRKS